MGLTVKDAEVRERRLKAVPDGTEPKPPSAAVAMAITGFVSAGLISLVIAAFLVGDALGFAVLGAVLLVLAVLIARS